MLTLCGTQAVICLAQAIFKLTQWPRSAWEVRVCAIWSCPRRCACSALHMLTNSHVPSLPQGIYIPLCETVQYSLLYSKLGYVSVGVNDQSHLPWVRYSFWMITTPVLLSQIQQIAEVKIRGYLFLNRCMLISRRRHIVSDP